MPLADLLLSGQADSDACYLAIDDSDDADVAAVLALAEHPSGEVRRAAMSTIPLLTHGDPPTQELLDVVTRGTTDPDPHVRDWACFALGTQWREVDTPGVRQALADRLDDDDHETAREALVGLAHRRDLQVLERVRAALSRPEEDAWLLELEAAGALGEASLHPLVLRHQDGWDDPRHARVADAVRRLTDPAGPGDDVLDGVAEISRRRAHGSPDHEVMWAWTVMDGMLDIAPDRARGLLEAVAERLAGDDAATDELVERSALAGLLESA